MNNEVAGTSVARTGTGIKDGTPPSSVNYSDGPFHFSTINLSAITSGTGRTVHGGAQRWLAVTPQGAAPGRRSLRQKLLAQKNKDTQAASLGAPPQIPVRLHGGNAWGVEPRG
jgi:hypothetical protein